MRFFNRLAAILQVLALLGATLAPLAARSRKGEKLMAQGRVAEVRKDWDAALELYEQALSEDPADPAYQLVVSRARFQAATTHISRGFNLRSEGNLTQALIEFQKAYQIDPSLTLAQQEVRRTQQMIEREKKKAQEPGMTPEKLQAEAGLTPAEVERKKEEEKLSRILSVPELKPLNPQVINNLVLRNQTPRVLFETVGKLAGVNVLFDPDFLTQSTKAQSVEISNSTLEQALDYLSLITKSFWKPISSNTIFVTQDNTTKRRDYEEQVMKVFYLNNVNTPQELQEILTTVRSVADLQRLFVYNAQNAIIARGEADRIALAEKIINDLDKPKREVVVDVIVMEADRTRSRDIATAVAQNGLNIPIVYNKAGSTSTPTTPANGTTVTPPAATGTPGLPLSNLHISTRDYSVTLPGGLLQLLMSDSNTRILQSPQVRAIDGAKATLKIGQKVPTATGSFQPGIGGVGINPLVNTQFTFIDVGVNVDMTPTKIHDNGEVSMHVEVEISSVNSHVNLGGIDQPVIGQRKVIHDIRMKEGEINLLGGLMQLQETKTVSGVPGLSSIPLIRRLFTTESMQKDSSELVIALVPHIVRKPEITAENQREIAVGNQTVVKLNYAPRTPSPQEPQPPAQPGQQPVPPTQPPAAALPAQPPTAVVTPPAGAVTPPVTAPPPPEPAQPPKPEAPEAAKPATPAKKPVAAFSPAQAQAQVGGAVSLSIVVNDVENLFSAPLSIRFDPKVLRVNDATRGDLLQNDNNPVAFTKNIQNDAGEAAVGLSRYFGRPGISGSGALVTFVFQAVAAGSTTITVAEFNPRDAKGQLIEIKPPQATVTVR